MLQKSLNIVVRTIILITIICLLSACSTACYDPGETSFSGIKIVKIPGVKEATGKEWIKSDIKLSAGQDKEISVAGSVNLCPPADPDDCSDKSDYCNIIYLYPYLCDEHDPAQPKYTGYSIMSQGSGIEVQDETNLQSISYVDNLYDTKNLSSSKENVFNNYNTNTLEHIVEKDDYDSRNCGSYKNENIIHKSSLKKRQRNIKVATNVIRPYHNNVYSVAKVSYDNDKYIEDGEYIVHEEVLQIRKRIKEKKEGRMTSQPRYQCYNPSNPDYNMCACESRFDDPYWLHACNDDYSIKKISYKDNIFAEGDTTDEISLYDWGDADCNDYGYAQSNPCECPWVLDGEDSQEWKCQCNSNYFQDNKCACSPGPCNCTPGYAASNKCECDYSYRSSHKCECDSNYAARNKCECDNNYNKNHPCECDKGYADDPANACECYGLCAPVPDRSNLMNVPVMLNKYGEMVCSDHKDDPDGMSQIARVQSMVIFDKEVHAGDSLSVELIPVREFNVSQDGMGSNVVSCQCLADDTCTGDDISALFYNVHHKLKDDRNMLYGVDETVDSYGNVKEYKCNNNVLTKKDLYNLCAYGGHFCMLSVQHGKEQFYHEPLVKDEKHRVLYASRFNYPLENNVNLHMPNMLAIRRPDTNSGSQSLKPILTHHAMHDLRRYTPYNQNFVCNDVYLEKGKGKYESQFDFYNANYLCDLANGVNTEYYIPINNNQSTVTLPGKMPMPNPNTSSADMKDYDKVYENLDKGYGEEWLPYLSLEYLTQSPAKNFDEIKRVSGTVFAPNNDSRDFLGTNYLYKIPDTTGDNEQVFVTAGIKNTVNFSKGGIMFKLKRYCIRNDGENLYAYIGDTPPSHEPGTQDSDIPLKVKFKDLGDGIFESEAIILNSDSRSGDVYFGLKGANVGDTTKAIQSNNYYTIQYNAKEYPPILSAPINALISFVKQQLFGTSSDPNDPGLIRPMYDVFRENLYPLFIYLLIIYITIYGILLMSGMIQNIQYDFFIKIIKLAIILAFIGNQSWDYVVNIIYNFFILGVQDILDSTSQSVIYITTDFTFLDITLGMLFDHTTILRISALLFSGPVGFIMTVMILHGIVEYSKAMFLFVLKYMMIILAYGWLIFLAPLFVMCLMFEATKDLFANWIKLLVNFALQPLFLFVLVGMMNAIMLYSINNLLSFGICGSKCALYIKLGEIEGQNVGFCLMSFFLPQGYEASITAAQYMGSMTDPMVNFFGLPFGITNVMLFYLAAFSIGKLMSIAERLAQTISGSMASFQGAVGSAYEAFRWSVGADNKTQYALKQALQKSLTKEDVDFDDSGDRKKLQDAMPQNRTSRRSINIPDDKSDNSDNSQESSSSDDNSSDYHDAKESSSSDDRFHSAQESSSSDDNSSDYHDAKESSSSDDRFHSAQESSSSDDSNSDDNYTRDQLGNDYSQEQGDYVERNIPMDDYQIDNDGFVFDDESSSNKTLDYDKASDTASLDDDLPPVDYYRSDSEYNIPKDYDIQAEQSIQEEDYHYDDAENQRLAKQFDEYVQSNIKEHKDQTSGIQNDNDEE